MATTEQSVTFTSHGLFTGRRGRRIREALQAYLFLFPGTLLLLIFNLLPVGCVLRTIREKYLWKEGYDCR